MPSRKCPNDRLGTILGKAQESLDQKRLILLFRWMLILVVVGLLLYGERGVLFPSRASILALFFIVTNVVLSFVPSQFFGKFVLTGSMLILDVGFVTAAIYVSGNSGNDLYLLYYLTIFLAALSRDVKISVLSSVVVVLLYGGISSWQMDSNQFLTTSFLMRIPFFLLTALFAGFLASQCRLKELEKEETALFNVRLQQELEKARGTEERARLQLLNLYQHNQNILESLGTGVLAVNRDQFITTFNAEASRIIGVHRNAAVGRILREVPNLAPFHPHLAAVVEGGRVCARGEIVAIKPDGTQVPVGISTAILRDPQQRPCGAIAVFKDLSELKDLTRKLKRSEHLALLGEMAASVAHEIRNPLNSILGFAELVVEKTEDADRRKHYAQIIVEEALRIERIVGDTLLFSKEAPEMLDGVDLNEILASCAASLADRSQKASVEILLDLASGIPLFRGNPGRLEQVFNNLILNAIQAMPEGGQVSITTRMSDGTLRTTISDTGPGVPPEMLDRIFLPFFTTKSDGTGLGLAVCGKILEDHGGSVEVENNPERGAAFKVTLPVPGASGDLAQESTEQTAVT